MASEGFRVVQYAQGTINTGTPDGTIRIFFDAKAQEGITESVP